MRLNDKVAIVTGGSQEIGKAIAFGLAEHGADFVVNSSRAVEDRILFQKGEHE